MPVLCPFCKATIEARPDGVRCARCATPHHRDCWVENRGTCSVHACGGTEHRPFTRRAATRIVLSAGRQAVRHALDETRARLGGKSVVALLLLSIVVVGLFTGGVARGLHAGFAHGVEVVLGGVFVVLAAWIAALLYRGERLDDDLRLQVAETDLGSYYQRLWGGLTGERGTGDGGCGSGCGNGCSGVDGEGVVLLLAILLVVAVVVAVGPLVAWIAIELVYPLVVLAVYGLLYGALSLAVHAHDRYEGRLLASIVRGALFAAVYTALVGAVFVALYATITA